MPTGAADPDSSGMLSLPEATTTLADALLLWAVEIVQGARIPSLPGSQFCASRCSLVRGRCRLQAGRQRMV